MPGGRWDDEPPGHHQHNSNLPLPTVDEKDYRTSSSLDSHSLPTSFELDGVAISGDGAGEAGSWKIGMPWFRQAISPTSTKGGDVEDSSRLYYGGLMRSQGSIPVAEPSTTPRTLTLHHNRHSQQPHGLGRPANSKPTNAFPFFGSGRGRNNASTGASDISKVPSFFRTLSHLTQHSTTGRDSIADFDDSEWTPPDSSYGAAIPVFGCIPKPVRRTIEFTLIAMMILGFVYLLVTTSIHITNERNKIVNNSTSPSSHNNGGRIALDDDLYVEDYRANDDLYNNEQNADDDGGGNGDDDDGYGYDNSNGYAGASCYGDDCYRLYGYDDDGNRV